MLFKNKLEGELFRGTVSEMMRPIENVIAIEVYDAIFKIVSNEEILIEILSVLPSSSMQLITNEYKQCKCFV